MLKKSQIKFFYYFIIIFIIGFILLYTAGFVPETIKTEEGDSLRTLWDKAQKNETNNQRQKAESPSRIVIESIGVDSIITNPQTTNIATLDEYLKQGAVRYPGSGLLGEGNMFIFGHSTGLAVVRNQAYKAFNGLKNLKVGDVIKVYGGSENKVYIYKVNSVKLVDKDQTLVKFDDNKDMLTLSTCNTFGQKEERHVVEADFVSISRL